MTGAFLRCCMRVLIVDDNDIALTVLQSALTDAGYEVETARDALRTYVAQLG